VSETRHVNWDEVGEAFWLVYTEATRDPITWAQLPQRKKDIVIAGCKAAVTLAVEES
jgi:hypothetical protein